MEVMIGNEPHWVRIHPQSYERMIKNTPVSEAKSRSEIIIYKL